MADLKILGRNKVVSGSVPEIKVLNARSDLMVKRHCGVDYAPTKDFLTLFKEQVAKFPEITAVVSEEESINFKELSLRSDQLAHYLRDSGIQRGDFVGLSVSNGPDLIIGILGILKSGGVYLPLDPKYPERLLKFILQDANPRLILTQRKFAYLFSDYGIPIFNLNKGYQCKNEEGYNFSVALDDPAYVVYTSGSTGKPKGIVVTHRSLPNIGISHRSFYPEKIRALVSGGICFDASILVIFHSILNGGCLYLSTYESDHNIKSLSAFIEKNPVNFMICVPSLYERILENPREFSSLKVVSLTGEPLPHSLCLLHAKFVSDAALYNEYGPTECAIGATIKKVYDPVTRRISKDSVGIPLANTRVHILNNNLQSCPIGSKGEICIEGVGLAQGYLNNKELSQKRFIHVALDGKNEVRLYRTGDLGQFLPNGEIEFLGRMEQLVNLENQSIYLGELENVIYRHPKIRAAVVSKLKNNLICFITTTANAPIEHSLKEHLARSLPNHMVPQEIIRLNQFPLSPNGKIDRALLVATSLVENRKCS